MLSIFLKLHNVLIILTVILAPSVLSTWRNLPLKPTIYLRSHRKRVAISACRRHRWRHHASQ